jgi:hypothetical protein
VFNCWSKLWTIKKFAPELSQFKNSKLPSQPFFRRFAI